MILGSAMDVVQHCGAPRFVFTDFPLGNPCGRPFDQSMQRSIVTTAIELLESATAPRAVTRTPFSWGSDNWRREYMEVGPHNAAELKKQGDARRKMRAGMSAQRV